MKSRRVAADMALKVTEIAECVNRSNDVILSVFAKDLGRTTPILREYAQDDIYSHRRRLLQFLLPIRHLRLEPREDARMHLADARFGQVERRADLLHRHLLEVVEDDDEPLGARETLGDQL